MNTGLKSVFAEAWLTQHVNAAFNNQISLRIVIWELFDSYWIKLQNIIVSGTEAQYMGVNEYAYCKGNKTIACHLYGTKSAMVCT